MPQGAVPRRYAEAAFELAREKGKLDRWRTDLSVAAAVLSNPRLLAVLDDPDTPATEKRQMVDTALTVQADPDVLHLIYLLTERGRIGTLARVAQEFIEMANRAQSVVIADVTTAIPLDANAQKDVEERIKRLSGAKRVEVRNQVDPSIIGGIIARIGDVLYDGSVRTQLAQIAERIS
ncbi:MAG TPA: ATP synthase F1 subunit delta [Chloroflexia bacterium]|jgi:F-type H+-transporting ATPase subunit delta|nr:ATP synthase F1 subunit delta [Chloroflexia bacterium]